MPNTQENQTHTVVMTSDQYESFQTMLENEERITEEMGGDECKDFKRIWNLDPSDE